MVLDAGNLCGSACRIPRLSVACRASHIAARSSADLLCGYGFRSYKWWITQHAIFKCGAKKDRYINACAITYMLKGRRHLSYGALQHWYSKTCS